MSKDSAIGWTDHTFNPWWGCFKVSPGCQNCYAETFSKRTGHAVWGPPTITTRRFFGDAHWREPMKWARDADPYFGETGRRPRVFCASMADVFEDHTAVEPYRDRLWETISACSSLDWLLLTKRPENVMDMLPLRWKHKLPPHIWIGTSVENQAAADERIPHLLRVPAAVRFLSCEPLLGPVRLPLSQMFANVRPTGNFRTDPTRGVRQLQIMVNADDLLLHWVIAGGESGPRHRPMDLQWVRDLLDQCQAAGVATYVKQDSGLYPGRQGRIPDDLWLHEWPVSPASPTPTAQGVLL